jgi:hypothetical protein
MATTVAIFIAYSGLTIYLLVSFFKNVIKGAWQPIQ